MARRAVHDSAAATADCEGAREFALSRGHGVRGRAGGGRQRRVVREPRVLGIWAGRAVRVPDGDDGILAGHAGVQARMAAGRVDAGEHHAGIYGRGIHHRAARGGAAVCGRRFFVAGADADDQVFRRADDAAALPRIDSDWANDAGRFVPVVYTADGRGSRGGGGRDYAGEDAADDCVGTERGAERYSQEPRGECGGDGGEPRGPRFLDEDCGAGFAGDCGDDVGAADVSSDSGSEDGTAVESDRGGVCGGVWIFVRDGFVADLRADWKFIESDQWNGDCDADGDVRDVFGGALDGRGVFGAGADDWRSGVRGVVERRRDFTGFEDGISGGRDAFKAATGADDWRDDFGVRGRRNAEFDECGAGRVQAGEHCGEYQSAAVGRERGAAEFCAWREKLCAAERDWVACGSGWKLFVRPGGARD